MTKYLISFPGPAMEIPQADWAAVGDAAHAVIREAKAAGVYVFGGGINEDVAPLMVAADGTFTNETYPQTKELDGGFCVLELPSREAAVEWAAKIAKACRCSQELREFQYDPAYGADVVMTGVPADNALETPMHEGSCHCGAVRLTLPSTPTVATRCNCSLCRRSGGPWVYFEFGTVKITGHPESTAEYIWGDRTLRNVRCKTCGCVTHWEPLAPEPGARHGVNLGNFAPELIASVRVRRFDGADTWQFLDE